jgi:endonuclease/exonuclease/phosphatase family metal-dependent hydrolase
VFFVAAIYASTIYLQRRMLWRDLSHLQNLYMCPWIFIGDFNAVLDAHEKSGRRPPPRVSCDDFLGWSNVHSLVHLPTTWVQLTWNNGRFGGEYVALRLDMVVANMHWIDTWQRINCCALIQHDSDHHPLLLTQEFSTSQHAVPFKFFKAWLPHEDCSQVVLETWNKPVVGSPMSSLQ